jgi:uncharacterized membrane protein
VVVEKWLQWPYLVTAGSGGGSTGLLRTVRRLRAALARHRDQTDVLQRAIVAASFNKLLAVPAAQPAWIT